MNEVSRRWLVVVVLTAGSFAAAVPSPARLEARTAQDTQAPAAPIVLSRAEQEAFLATARVVRTRSVSIGITRTLRATLSDGRVTHDASIQTIDEEKTRFESVRGVEFNFRDTWRHNVAAYRLDRLLDLGMIPPSVERGYRGRRGAFTWWVDDVLMDEAARLKNQVPLPDVQQWNEQMWHVRLFDQLIYNTDRNLGNLLIDTTWRIWMIDHSRAFRLFDTPRSLGSIAQCDRAVYERLKALDRETLAATMAGYLTGPEISALLERRDVIVQHLEATDGIFEWDRPQRP